tara:strand:+ start:109 stop:1833 length:1725 start_codon:yes stop_codon:yes gene_type:complete
MWSYARDVLYPPPPLEESSMQNGSVASGAEHVVRIQLGRPRVPEVLTVSVESASALIGVEAIDGGGRVVRLARSQREGPLRIAGTDWAFKVPGRGRDATAKIEGPAARERAWWISVPGSSTCENDAHLGISPVEMLLLRVLGSGPQATSEYAVSIRRALRYPSFDCDCASQQQADETAVQSADASVDDAPPAIPPAGFVDACARLQDDQFVPGLRAGATCAARGGERGRFGDDYHGSFDGSFESLDEPFELVACANRVDSPQFRVLSLNAVSDAYSGVDQDVQSDPNAANLSSANLSATPTQRELCEDLWDALLDEHHSMRTALCGMELWHGATALRAPETSSSWLRLTAGAGHRGAAWYHTKMRVADGFESEFRFRALPSAVYPVDPELGDAGDACAASMPEPPEWGGGGLAFVIHSDPRELLAIGCRGSGLGVGPDLSYFSTCAQRIYPAISVELRTHRNVSSPAQTVPSALDVISSESGGDGRRVLISAILGDDLVLGDGRAHRVRVEYTTPGGGRLSVFIDQIPEPVVSLELTMQAALDNAGFGFVGFTAATGVAPVMHELLDWQFTSDF